MYISIIGYPIFIIFKVNGNNAMTINNDIEEPINERTTASKPLPFISNLWPGKTEIEVDVSGAPRKIDGIESRNVFVIAMDKMIITRSNGEKIFNK